MPDAVTLMRAYAQKTISAKQLSAEQVQRQRQEHIRKLARLDGMKRTLFTQANANQPQEARRLLSAICQELPADDKFTNVEAPKAIAAAYQNLAARAASNRQWKSALQLANAGVELTPNFPELRAEINTYNIEFDKERDIDRMREKLRSPGPFKVNELAAFLKRIRATFPSRSYVLESEFGNRMRANITRAAPRNREMLALSASGLRALRALFPAFHARAVTQVYRATEDAVKSLERKNPVAVQALLRDAKNTFPNARTLANLAIKLPAKPSPIAARGLEQVKAGELSAARVTLAKVSAAATNAANLPALRRELDEREAKARADFENYQRYVAARRESEGRPYFVRAKRWWRNDSDPTWTMPSARPRAQRGQCNTALAGLGRGRGTCYDSVNGQRGPVLVVVPPSGANSAFAIGK